MNPLGGWGKIIGLLKVWVARVRGKLYHWPVSKNVANAVIDGLVINRFVFRFQVNTPPELLCDQLEGSIAKLYRSAYGMPQKTSRKALFDIIQVVSPSAKLWSTIAAEAYKAFNSVNSVLRDLMWGQWTRCGSMSHNPDLWKIKSRLKGMGMSFKKIHAQVDTQAWSISAPTPKGCANMYIVGNASGGGGMGV